MLIDAALLGPALVLPASAEAAQTEEAIRFASYAYASDPLDLPASTVWFPRIVGPVEIAQDALSLLGSGGVVALTVAEIVAQDQDATFRDMARYGTADGRTLELRVAEVVDPRASDFGTPLRSTAAVWTGRAARVERAPGRRARIALDDLTTRMAAPLQSSRYTGSGGLNGAAALADRPKPMCLGAHFNVAPVYVGEVDLGDGAKPTYQTHWRGIVAHDAIRIRGVAQTIVGSSPGPGQARDWPALGLFQLGGSADGTVSCAVRGESDGYPNTTGTILWRLLTITGPQFAESERDSDAWAFAETDLGGPVGFYQGAEDISSLEASQRLLAGCAGVLAGDRFGRLRLFDPFATVSDIQFDLSAPEIVAEPEPVPLPAALWPAAREVQVEYGVNGAVITDIGTAADAELRQRLTEAAPPVASASSATITARVLTQRILRLPGLYSEVAGAQARASQIVQWLEGGPRAWSVTTDRYLGVINLGDWGRVTYPVAGLDAGFSGVVVAMREELDRRRVTLTMLGSGG
jgi:hypothetical protein